MKKHAIVSDFKRAVYQFRQMLRMFGKPSYHNIPMPLIEGVSGTMASIALANTVTPQTKGHLLANVQARMVDALETRAWNRESGIRFNRHEFKWGWDPTAYRECVKWRQR